MKWKIWEPGVESDLPILLIDAPDFDSAIAIAQSIDSKYIAGQPI